MSPAAEQSVGGQGLEPVEPLDIAAQRQDRADINSPRRAATSLSVRISSLK